ncbi:glycine cleavage system aminomethyltransferase GcvT [Nocardia panacis]|uniref:Aminomethyltransferase n=1 Tax=Nocardia panacis TaxID=2340916 RepID=A0A3A4KA29_9NOCA|nr:glycine cleavage system aminomethyltransferase GcvT [Nocardia panacis]RJO78442.1 glycine cleavage system aminomethyltransferase GcvT [Nocardia panacis]
MTVRDARASTPLTDLHTRLGATLTDYAGWRMPLRYDSELAEHHAVRTAAGLFDLSHMGEIEITGPEAGRMLDHALTGHLSAVAVGRARYTMLCHDNGAILDDLVVYHTDPDRYLVVANAANTTVVHILLRDRAHGFAVEVTDRTREHALLAVQGPGAAAILAPLTGTDPTSLKYYSATRTTLADTPILLARTGYTGEDGFEIYCPPEVATHLWQTITEAGTPHGLRPAGLAARDTLRLEAGMPLYGNELHVGLTPYEAGLGRVVAHRKPGDFVGRTALAHRRDTGPQRLLVGLIADGRRAGRHGYRVLAGDRVIGEITSGALSPTLGHPIAMALLDLDHTEPGTPVDIDLRGQRLPAAVTTLPFYTRS